MHYRDMMQCDKPKMIDFIEGIQERQSRFCEKIDLWFSLLPAEYQEDVFGISWSTIGLTILLAIILIGALMWEFRDRHGLPFAPRRMSAKQIIKDLQELVIAESAETLKYDNLWMSLKNKMDKVLEELEEVKQQRATAEEDCNKLKTEIEEQHHENQLKDDELNEAKANLELQKQENRVLINQSQEYQNQLEEKKLEVYNVEADIAAEQEMISELIKQLKQNGKEKLDFEEKLKDCENQLESRMKAESELSRKLREWEQKSKKCELENEKLRKEVKDAVDEHHRSKQEFEELKDFLLNNEVIRKCLIAANEEGMDDEKVAAKQKQLTDKLIEMWNMELKVKEMEGQNDRLLTELHAEKQGKEEAEAALSNMEEECKAAKLAHTKAQNEAKNYQDRYNAVQEFFAKRDVELQGKLGKALIERQAVASELAHDSNEVVRMQNEIDAHKEKAQEVKRLYLDSELKYKKEICMLERKHHQTWMVQQDHAKRADKAEKELARMRYEMEDLRRRSWCEPRLLPFVYRRRVDYGDSFQPPSFPIATDSFVDGPFPPEGPYRKMDGLGSFANSSAHDYRPELVNREVDRSSEKAKQEIASNRQEFFPNPPYYPPPPPPRRYTTMMHPASAFSSDAVQDMPQAHSVPQVEASGVSSSATSPVPSQNPAPTPAMTPAQGKHAKEDDGFCIV